MSTRVDHQAEESASGSIKIGSLIILIIFGIAAVVGIILLFAHGVSGGGVSGGGR